MTVGTLDPQAMSRSHTGNFRFLVDCLKSGKFPVQDTPIAVLEPRVVGSDDELLRGIIRSACLTFEDGRLFDFGVMPNADIVRLSTQYMEIDRAALHPPFEDWRFCFCATSDFGASQSDVPAEAPKFVTSLYVLEGKHVNAVQMTEFIVASETGQFWFIASMYFELPISTESHVTFIGCAEDFTDKLRLLKDSALDPCLAALVMLNTKGVDYLEKKPPRGERRRAERAGQTSPSHWAVDASEYFTALRHTADRGDGDGERDHASPIPHLRRGHWRTLASGKRTWIRDCLVNVKAQDQTAFVDQMPQRIAYKAEGLLARRAPNV